MVHLKLMIIHKSQDKDNYFNKNIKVKDIIQTNKEEQEKDHADEIIKQASPTQNQEVKVEKENIIDLEDDMDEEDYDDDEKETDEE